MHALFMTERRYAVMCDIIRTLLQADNPGVIKSLTVIPEDIKAKHRGVYHRQQLRKRKAFEQPTSRHWYADSDSWVRATTLDPVDLAQEQQARSTSQNVVDCQSW